MDWYCLLFFLKSFVSCLFYSFPSLVFMFPWFTILGVLMLMCVPYFYVDLIYFCMLVISVFHTCSQSVIYYLSILSENYVVTALFWYIMLNPKQLKMTSVELYK